MSDIPIVDEPVPVSMPPGRNSMPGDSGFQMDGVLRRMVEGKSNVEIVESKVVERGPVEVFAKRGLIAPHELTAEQRRSAGLFLPGGQHQPFIETAEDEDPLEAQMRLLQGQLEEKRQAKVRALSSAVPSQSAPPASMTEIKRLAGEIIIETATADPDKLREACRELAVAILTQCR